MNRPAADGLAGLLTDYTGLPPQAPPLGPALPDDLGPMLYAGAAPNTVVPATTSDAEAQRRAQETEAARVSRLSPRTGQHQPQGVTQFLPGASAGTAASQQFPPR